MISSPNIMHNGFETSVLTTDTEEVDSKILPAFLSGTIESTNNNPRNIVALHRVTFTILGTATVLPEDGGEWKMWLASTTVAESIVVISFDINADFNADVLDRLSLCSYEFVREPFHYQIDLPSDLVVPVHTDFLKYGRVNPRDVYTMGQHYPPAQCEYDSFGDLFEGENDETPDTFAWETGVVGSGVLNIQDGELRMSSTSGASECSINSLFELSGCCEAEVVFKDLGENLDTVMFEFILENTPNDKILFRIINGNIINPITDNSPLLTFDSLASLVGSSNGTQWMTELGSVSNQTLVVNFPVSTAIDGFSYENHHNTGTETNNGAKTVEMFIDTINNFSTDFIHLDTVSIESVFSGEFSEHTHKNTSDIQTIEFSEVVPKSIKLNITDNWGGEYIGIRNLTFLNNGIPVPYTITWVASASSVRTSAHRNHSISCFSVIGGLETQIGSSVDVSPSLGALRITRDDFGKFVWQFQPTGVQGPFPLSQAYCDLTPLTNDREKSEPLQELQTSMIGDLTAKMRAVTSVGTPDLSVNWSLFRCWARNIVHQYSDFSLDLTGTDGDPLSPIDFHTTVLSTHHEDNALNLQIQSNGIVDSDTSVAQEVMSNIILNGDFSIEWTTDFDGSVYGGLAHTVCRLYKYPENKRLIENGYYRAGAYFNVDGCDANNARFYSRYRSYTEEVASVSGVDDVSAYSGIVPVVGSAVKHRFRRSGSSLFSEYHDGTTWVTYATYFNVWTGEFRFHIFICNDSVLLNSVRIHDISVINGRKIKNMQCQYFVDFSLFPNGTAPIENIRQPEVSSNEDPTYTVSEIIDGRFHISSRPLVNYTYIAKYLRALLSFYGDISLEADIVVEDTSYHSQSKHARLTVKDGSTSYFVAGIKVENNLWSVESAISAYGSHMKSYNPFPGVINSNTWESDASKSWSGYGGSLKLDRIQGVGETSYLDNNLEWQRMRDTLHDFPDTTTLANKDLYRKYTFPRRAFSYLQVEQNNDDYDYTHSSSVGSIRLRSDGMKRGNNGSIEKYHQLAMSEENNTSIWTSNPIDLSELSGLINGSVISWTGEFNVSDSDQYTDISEASILQARESVQVHTSIDGGATYQECTNGEAIPLITESMATVGVSLIIKYTGSNSQSSITSSDGEERRTHMDFMGLEYCFY